MESDNLDDNQENQKKKRGRPAKVDLNIPEKNDTTLEEALKRGEVVKKEDISNLINEELSARASVLKKEIRDHIDQEKVKEKEILLSNSHKKKLESFKLYSSLTNDKLCLYLMGIGATRHDASYLEDSDVNRIQRLIDLSQFDKSSEEFDKNKKINDKRISTTRKYFWKRIRENMVKQGYKSPKA